MALPTKPKAQPYNPLTSPLPSLAEIERRARKRTDEQINAAVAGATAGLPTEQALRDRSARQVADLNALSGALTSLSQKQVDQSQARTLQLQDAYRSATAAGAQPAATAAIAAGGQAQQGGLGQLVASLGSLGTTALAANAQAAGAQGAIDTRRAIAGLGTALTERDAEIAARRAEIEAKRPELYDSLVGADRDFAFQVGSAREQTRLADLAYGLDVATAQQDAAADAAKLGQDQSQWEAEMALKRNSAASMDAYRQAQLDLAQQRIDASLARAAGTGGNAAAKRRDTITREANRLAQRLRAQTTATPGSTSTRTTGMRHKVLITVTEPNPSDPTPNDPSNDTLYPPTRRVVDATYDGSWADVVRQATQAYGVPPDAVRANGAPTPLTEDVKTPGTKARTYSEDQVRGQVYQLLVSYKLKPGEATRIANQIVPRRRPGSGQTPPPPTQADAGDR